MNHAGKNIESMYEAVNKIQEKKARQVQQEMRELAMEGLSVNYI